MEADFDLGYMLEHVQTEEVRTLLILHAVKKGLTEEPEHLQFAYAYHEELALETRDWSEVEELMKKPYFVRRREESERRREEFERSGGGARVDEETKYLAEERKKGAGEVEREGFFGRRGRLAEEEGNAEKAKRFYERQVVEWERGSPGGDASDAERAYELAIRKIGPERAAKVLENTRKFERAARAYEELDDVSSALRCYERAGLFDGAAELCLRTGDNKGAENYRSISDFMAGAYYPPSEMTLTMMLRTLGKR